MKVTESNSLRYIRKSHLNLEKRDFLTSSCFLLTIWPPKWPLKMTNMTFMIEGGRRAFGRCYATYYTAQTAPLSSLSMRLSVKYVSLQG